MADRPRMEAGKATETTLAAQLWAFCTSVAFERAAYYGLQSILALYLADMLLNADNVQKLWLVPTLARFTGAEGLALAGIITGAFTSTAALAPVIGGIIADRLIGAHRAILAGGTLMAAGHGLLTIEAALVPALGLVALGSGLFKGPVAARLSGLYAADDPQRVEGFRLFYLAINMAGLIAPLVIGTLGERVNWHAGFALSCAAMVAGLAIYRLQFGVPASEGEPAGPAFVPAAATPRAGFAGLALLGLSLALLTVPNAQLTNAYLMWVSQRFERSLWGWDFPASWMIAADGLLGLFALAASGLFWREYERRAGPVTAAAKAILGAILVVAAAGVLVLAGALFDTAKVPVIWGLAFQLCNSLGLANALPAAMAIFGQSSTRRYASTVMAGFYLSLFAGALTSTLLASQFPSLPITTFWLLHAACALCGLIGLAVVRPGSIGRDLARA